MKKKLLALALALALTAACAPGGPPAESPQPPASPSSQEAVPAEPSPSSREAALAEPSRGEEPREPGTWEENWDRLMASYSYTPGPGESIVITGFDGQVIPFGEPQEELNGGRFDAGRLCRMFITANHGEEELLALCGRIEQGEKLGDLLQPEGSFYTILADEKGEEVGDAWLGEDFSLGWYGSFPSDSKDILRESYRRDFLLTDELKSAISESGLDPDRTTLTFCIISEFASGALLADGEGEFFVPTTESMESLGILECWRLYPVPDLFRLIREKIGSIYPRTREDAKGFPPERTAIPSGTNERPGDALADYLLEHLADDQYRAVLGGRWTTVMTPDREAVETVVKEYPGRAVPVAYWEVPFTKAQIDRAYEDLLAFLADHPEIVPDEIGGKPLVGRDYTDVTLCLRAEEPAVEEFVAQYPVKDIFRIEVYPNGYVNEAPTNPD